MSLVDISIGSLGNEAVCPHGTSRDERATCQGAAQDCRNGKQWSKFHFVSLSVGVEDVDDDSLRTRASPIGVNRGAGAARR